MSVPTIGAVPDDDAEDRALAARFLGVVQHMRADSRWKLQMFLTDMEAEMGGTLIVRAAGSRQHHQPAEAQYVPSGFTVVFSGEFACVEVADAPTPRRSPQR